jgi:phosphohistidine phosphatase SixA
MIDSIPDNERFIVLMRHGEAESTSPGTSDAERSLTAEGHAAMKHIGHGIEKVLPRVRAIYTSPLLRAQQTARWVSKAYRLRAEVRTVDGLAPGASREQFLELVASIAERRAVIVGHAPNLREALYVLTSVDLGNDPLPGGCYGIRLRSDTAGVLEWVLPPGILHKLGE